MEQETVEYKPLLTRIATNEPRRCKNITPMQMASILPCDTLRDPVPSVLYGLQFGPDRRLNPLFLTLLPPLMQGLSSQEGCTEPTEEGTRNEPPSTSSNVIPDMSGIIQRVPDTQNVLQPTMV